MKYEEMFVMSWDWKQLASKNGFSSKFLSEINFILESPWNGLAQSQVQLEWIFFFGYFFSQLNKVPFFFMPHLCFRVTEDTLPVTRFLGTTEYWVVCYLFPQLNKVLFFFIPYLCFTFTVDTLPMTLSLGTTEYWVVCYNTGTFALLYFAFF